MNNLTEEGITMVPFGQGWLSMAAPLDETERLIVAQQLAHDGRPVMAWMAGNAVVAEDPAGNRKLDKSKSREKIDGMVALVMGIGRASVHQEEVTVSVYETRAVRRL